MTEQEIYDYVDRVSGKPRRNTDKVIHEHERSKARLRQIIRDREAAPKTDPVVAKPIITDAPVDVCRACHGRQNVCQTIDGFGRAVRGNVWITCPTCMGSGGR